MDWTVFALLALGLGVLVLGAESLVRGASRLAAAVGVSPLVVGLTVVAFGTSSPELAVSVQSALAGRADLALGNVVGSNIFNVLFILGISASIAPLAVPQRLVRRDVPLMIGVSVLLLVLALDRRIGRLDGALLFAGILGYTWLLIRGSRQASRASAAQEGAAPGGREGGSWLRDAGLVAAGLAMLVLGSRWLVRGAVEIADALGVSELVIGLTIVAAGTSLPEVATSVLATVRGHRDIAIGNVVGSNIFNVLAVLGLSSLVAPEGIEVLRTALIFDIPVMIAVAVACLPVFLSGLRIARWEGALFLGFYVAYTSWLVIHTAHHPILPDSTSASSARHVPVVRKRLEIPFDGLPTFATAASGSKVRLASPGPGRRVLRRPTGGTAGAVPPGRRISSRAAVRARSRGGLRRPRVASAEVGHPAPPRGRPAALACRQRGRSGS